MHQLPGRLCRRMQLIAHIAADGVCTPAGGADATVRYWGLQDSPPAAEAGKGKQEPPADVQSARSVPGLLKTFQTKATPVFALHFTQRNLLLGTGALTLPPQKKRLPTR